MEIKVKGTSKVGILAFDLSDPYASIDMEKARNVQNVCRALSDFTNALRSIRKYNAVKEIPDIDTQPIYQAILDTEDYYRALFFTCLNENDAILYVD
jgi:hypothetical protein